ncbi:co-chaperone GroES [Candidatus Cryosericum septentrionale]|jgi:chaperonin GroES|uniref:Co-chaperonin GroES n=1 Tax=Candidatus Cryosericum septentrionale TaxID=2290913 RepID=A0A398E257_9BACT|nr:co-chaperone GroES [Candidatus Cryosericum septentrionale]RIE17664.1 co-chaperone GroES [Candidatus Cryosericum septentrionale]
MTKLVPIGDHVVIKVEKAKETMKSGIVLPDSAKEKPQQGTVMAVGSGVMLDNGTKIPLEVKKGDKVFYSKYSGNEIKLDDEEYVVLSQHDILAIVK